MAVTSKDGLATLFVAAAGGIVAWHLAAPDTTFVGSTRWTGIAVLVLGLCACGTGAQLGADDRYVQVMGAVAAVPFLLVLAVLVTGSDVVLLAFAASVVAMWLGATIRHATTQPPSDAPVLQSSERELVRH